MSCQNNLKQLGIAMHNFDDTHKRFPPGAGNDAAPFGTATSTGWGSSWMVYLLPYIEQGPIADRWQFHIQSGYTNANSNTIVAGLIIPGYRCPSTPVD